MTTRRGSGITSPQGSPNVERLRQEVERLRSALRLVEARVVELEGAPASSGGGDPDASYVVLANTATLTNERQLAAGTGISVVDGGPGGSVTISSSVTQYTDEMVRDVMGVALVAGAGVTITPNDPADTITISASTTSLTVQELDGSPSVASTTTLQFAQADGFVVSTPIAGTARVDFDISTALDVLGSTHGSALFRGVTDWQALAPGTSGLPLRSNGAGFIPSYAALTNVGLAQMANNTFKGNVSGALANPADVTTTQLTAALNLFTSVLQGLAPASGGGTVNFLRADGTWTTPASSAPTVREVDGAPSIATISLLEFDQADGFVVSNPGGTQARVDFVISTALDTISSTRGAILYRGAAGWAALAPGTATHVLTSNGAGADPTYQAAGAGFAPAGSAYVTIGNDASLSAERALAASSPVTLTDGGANGSATIAFDQAVALGNNARLAVSRNSGATVGTRRRLNLIEGSNISISVVDDAANEEVDVTITGSGGAGSTSTAQGTVDFGTGDDYASVTVAAAWVTAGHRIMVAVRGGTADHPLDDEDVLIEDITATVVGVSASTSITVGVHAPNGTWGQYLVDILGAA